MTRRSFSALLFMTTTAIYLVVSASLAPSWRTDQALLTRTIQVTRDPARHMLNLGDALTRSGDQEGAVFWSARARETALASTVIPQRERDTIRAVAIENMVTVLLGWQDRTIRVDSIYHRRPFSPEGFREMAAYSGDRAVMITELLEELWVLPSRDGVRPR